MVRPLWIVFLVGAVACPGGVATEIVFENSRMRAVLGKDAVWKSLIDKTTGHEYCAASKNVRFATVRLSGKTHDADAARLNDGRLTVSFQGCDTQLVYAVTASDDWCALRIVEVFGTRPTHVTLLSLGVTITERGGSRLGAAWNRNRAICLRAISLQTQGSLSRRGDHTLLVATTQDAPGPKLEGGQYEETRLAGRVHESTCERLKQQGKDFVMLPAALCAKGGPPEFVEVEELAEVAGTHDVRSLVGAHAAGTIATVWHYLGKDGKLILNVPEAEVFDARGEFVTVQRVRGKAAAPVDHRRILLHFPSLPPGAVRQALKDATIELRKPVVLWVRAEDYQQCVGTMTKGSQVAIEEPDALGNVVLCNGPIDRSGRKPCYCEYRVEIPRKARWTLWARVRYPTGGDMSFGLVLPGEQVSLSGKQVLGNCGMNDKGWHWTGRGDGISSVPPGSPIVFDLEPGPFVFRVYPREGGGTAATNPRLDCFCLSEAADFVPTDADAAAALERK